MSTSPNPENAYNIEERIEALPEGKAAARRLKQFVADNAGLLLVVLAQVFFSMMNAAVKKLSTVDPPVSALELILVRMGITYICSLVYMLATRMEDPILGPKGIRSLLVFRGISGFIGLFGIYFSLEYLSLSDATVLTFLAPLGTAIAGALFLKERFRLLQGLAGVVSLFGVVLIARPPFLFGDDGPLVGLPNADAWVLVNRDSNITPAERVMAVGIALVGVLGATGAYTSIRAIGKRAHPMQVTAFYSSYSVIVSTIGMVVTKTPLIIPTRLDWFALLIMIGVFGFIGQVLLTMGLQREAAWRASMALYTQIVFATIFQRVFFNSSPSWLSVLGAMLILSSALYVALTKDPVEPKYENKGPITLDDEEYDHIEAALHAPPANHDNTADSPRQNTILH